jgi:hypothetical protein
MPKGKHTNHARGPASGAYQHGEVQRINGKRVATPEYRAWQQLKNRCLNPRGQDWRFYGGRGISLDPRWHEFENFLADMGRRPHPLLTLERKDGNQNYCKSNCEWATRTVQSRNRTYVKLTVAKATEIRDRYKAGGYTQKALAAEYAISQTHISAVIHGSVWKLEGKQ